MGARAKARSATAARLVLRALTGAVALIAAATLLGFLDRISWAFEPVTFFRLQYAVVLGGAAVFALLLRRFALAALATALAAVNVAVIAPRDLATAPPATARTSSLRLLILNVDAGNDRYAELRSLSPMSLPTWSG